MSIARSCRCVRLPRSCWYAPLVNWAERDAPVIHYLNQLVERHPRWGQDKCVARSRTDKKVWNHKRLRRVYRKMGLNQPRRTKKRLPARDAMPLFVPSSPNMVWSADFMSDALYHGSRFRTFNLIDDFAREALAIEIDTSLRADRILRVFEQLKTERPLPDVIRVDNGPEFLSDTFTDWMTRHGVMVQYIEPGKPNQNAYIERFNRTYREEVLNLYLFQSLNEVRDITSKWLTDYNELRPHDSLNGLSPASFLKNHSRLSGSELSV